jgi:hypothetical protein
VNEEYNQISASMGTTPCRIQIFAFSNLAFLAKFDVGAISKNFFNLEISNAMLAPNFIFDVI